jgi:hypothetical protein
MIASDEDDEDVERGDKKKKNLRKLILSVSCRKLIKLGTLGYPSTQVCGFQMVKANSNSQNGQAGDDMYSSQSTDPKRTFVFKNRTEVVKKAKHPIYRDKLVFDAVRKKTLIKLSVFPDSGSNINEEDKIGSVEFTVRELLRLRKKAGPDGVAVMPLKNEVVPRRRSELAKMGSEIMIRSELLGTDESYYEKRKINTYSSTKF